MGRFTWNGFHIKKFADRFLTCPHCGEYLLDCIKLFVLWLCRESHNIVCSIAHTVYATCNKLCSKMYSSKHIKIKTSFSCTCLARTLL